jgi:hypothetical protein
MGAERFFAWCLLVLWATWLFAVQGMLAAKSGPAPWIPDMGIVLLLMLDRRLSSSSMLLAILVITCARIGFSADPPLAILLGYGVLVASMRLLRRAVEVDQIFLRAILAGVGFLAINKYWAIARSIALTSHGQTIWPSGELPRSSLGMALATGLTIFVLGPFLVRLPGLSPLRRGDR